MAIREFTDDSGIGWKVWDTSPTRAGNVPLGYEHGWLTFESPTALRRLTPVPDGWQDFSDDELRRLCQTAQPRPHESGAKSPARRW